MLTLWDVWVLIIYYSLKTQQTQGLKQQQVKSQMKEEKLDFNKNLRKNFKSMKKMKKRNKKECLQQNNIYLYKIKVVHINNLWKTMGCKKNSNVKYLI